ncbi:Ca(2+)-dependent cysteine protease [Maublancomyces gigas]|uniref:Ca(2+)-dependent cysteine protease n=1 Tax=Discina gigas TaxID=1032678 RepID=A0ABR3GQK1_9PEZI
MSGHYPNQYNQQPGYPGQQHSYPPEQSPSYNYPPGQPPHNYYQAQQHQAPQHQAPQHPQNYYPIAAPPHQQQWTGQPAQNPGYPQQPAAGYVPAPTGPQSFNVPGATHLGYEYGPCTGKRKALLIGINYFGQRGQLRGCINDVKNMSTFLHQRFQYKREDMVILTDDQQNPRSQPTKQNIIQAMHWLVKEAQPTDSLFFHYSGHGGQTKDLDGDEGDGYDETIYPVDFRYNGHIVDDEMHRIMVAPLKPGVRLTAIFDSCHSGSALDLPYLYSTRGVEKEPNLAKEAATGLFDALKAYNRGDLGGVASSALGIFKRATTGRGAEDRAKRTKTSPADVIQWSGSKDSQTSADATEGGEATGAMSYAFIRALSKNPQQSYQQLLSSIRDELSGKYSQKPQLSCSHPLGNDGQPLDESGMEFKF